jgi:hypothetical protein
MADENEQIDGVGKEARSGMILFVGALAVLAAIAFALFAL